MSEYQNPSAAPTVEAGLHALADSAKARVQDKVEHYKERVQREPGKAVLVALAAGYVLHRLPIRSLIVSQVKLLSALAGPALLAYGAAKTCEALQREAKKHA